MLPRPQSAALVLLLLLGACRLGDLARYDAAVPDEDTASAESSPAAHFPDKEGPPTPEEDAAFKQFLGFDDSLPRTENAKKIRPACATRFPDKEFMIQACYHEGRKLLYQLYPEEEVEPPPATMAP